MIDAISMDTTTWIQLGLTLAHFLWQGALIACVLSVTLWLMRHRAPGGRYAACGGAMLLMAACPVGTMVYLRAHPLPFEIGVTPMLDETTGDGSESGKSSRERMQEDAFVDESAMSASLSDEASAAPPGRQDAEGAELLVQAADTAPAPVVGAMDTARPPSGTPAQESDGSAVWLRTGLTWTTLVWLIGVCMLSVRLLVGWVGLQRLQRQCVQALPARFEAVLGSLRERFGLGVNVRVLTSELVGEPVAFGLIRPIVLLPVSAVTGLPCELIEAMIAHELAHIRRYDVWVNLGQRVVETLLFYHPAVWWASGRMRLERELCCDDLAVAATGRRAAYADALAHLAGADRQVAATLGMGMMGPRLTLGERVRRVLEVQQPPRQARFWLAGPVSLVMAATLVLLGSIQAGEPAGPGSAVAATQPAGGDAAVEDSTPRKEEASITIAWDNITMTDALRSLAEQRGSSIVGLNLVNNKVATHKITLHSVEPMAFTEALTTLDIILVDFDCWMAEQEHYLAIRPLVDWYRRIPPENMFESVEAYRKARLPAWEIASLIYEPANRPTHEMADRANDSVPFNTVRSMVVRDGEAVALQGFVYYLDRVLEVLSKWDTPSSSARTTNRLGASPVIPGPLAPRPFTALGLYTMTPPIPVVTPATQPAGVEPNRYTLGRGDRLRIKMMDFVKADTESEFNPTVDEAGDIYVPQLGTVHVEGLTLNDLRQELETRSKDERIYARQVSPIITIDVVTRHARLDHVPVRARAAGIIAEVTVKDGKEVKKGDLVVRLDDEETQIEIKAAEVKVGAAHDAYARTKLLTERGTTSTEELSRLQAEQTLAELDLMRWKLRLERTRVTSPVDGVVSHSSDGKPVPPETLIGKKVEPGDTVMTVIVTPKGATTNPG